CASYWVRLIVPVVREDGRLVVDARDETPPDAGARDSVIEPKSAAPDPERGAAEPTRDRPVGRVPDLEPEEAW
ncbi:MAG TPA: hypothetical protein VFQ76_03815, partial [Longimicrobiaceae bacterium]|nr:hypothetical protein [Longimicrobiaceae bacterium]